MTQPVTLSHLRRRAEEQVDRLKEGLVTADPDRVPDLQAEIRAFRHIIKWLTDGAPPTPDPDDNNPGNPGGY